MKPNTITFVVVTLIIFAGGYWYFSSQSNNEPPLTESLPTENEAQTQFQMLVGQLQPISFKTDIFSDPRFTSLVDLTTPVAPEPSGRLDPFAPIGGATGM